MKKKINCTIEENVLEKLDEMAKERGIDRSTMISVMVYDSYNIVQLREYEKISNYFYDHFCEI